MLLKWDKIISALVTGVKKSPKWTKRMREICSWHQYHVLGYSCLILKPCDEIFLTPFTILQMKYLENVRKLVKMCIEVPPLSFAYATVPLGYVLASFSGFLLHFSMRQTFEIYSSKSLIAFIFVIFTYVGCRFVKLVGMGAGGGGGGGKFLISLHSLLLKI